MSDTPAPSTAATPASNAKAMTIVTWIAQIVVVAIFAMGAIPKFTGGADALAAKVPGGQSAVYAIGALEFIAIILLLIPKTAVYGASLAALIMIGAIGSHFGPVGMEGDFMTMFMMASVAFLASVTVLALRRKQLPIG